jgi:hypothetical protein
MNEGKINEQILNSIKEVSKDDMEIENFLKDLLFEEIEHPGRWQWRDIYSKKIKEYSERWDNNSEN